MANRKNHHYVPRFYLKRFSVNGEGKAIGLYNHAGKRFIANAPLKHQAYQPYLYGREDDVESALSHLEGLVARLFSAWTDEKWLIPPPLDSNAFSILKRFILYQLYRTPKAGDDMMVTLNEGLQKVLKVLDPDLYTKIEGGSLAHPDPVLLALTNAADKEQFLNYLDCRFVVNLSMLPLISSDAPVALYNQLLEQKGVIYGGTGLPARGLQIFYPIHPRLMICLYDPEAYTFNGLNCVGTESVEDIHQLNVLQFLGSHAQIFFDDTVGEKYARYLAENWEEMRREPQHISKMIPIENDRYQFFSAVKDRHVELSLSFLQTSKAALERPYEFGEPRHPSLERVAQRRS